MHPYAIFRFFGCFLVAWTMVFPTNMVVAQTDADKSFAQEAFKQGQIQYNLGRFENALVHFSKAYEIMPHGAFLFNIGQCHRHLNDHEKAIFFFEGYLRALPNAPNRQAVEELIAEHNSKLTLSKTQPKSKKDRAKAKKKASKTGRSKSSSAAAKIETTSPQNKNSTETLESPATDSWILAIIIGSVAIIGTGIAIFAITNRANSEDPSGGTGTSDKDASLGEYDFSGT